MRNGVHPVISRAPFISQMSHARGTVTECNLITMMFHTTEYFTPYQLVELNSMESRKGA